MSFPRSDGLFNIAEDLRLLAQAEKGEPGWRVYGWDGPWVSLGCFQHPERDLRSGAPVEWVMRPTGGKAVLHGHDVTVGLAAPLDMLAQADTTGRELARSIRTVYRLATRPILEAMRECGVPAVLGEELKNEKRRTKNEEEGEPLTGRPKPTNSNTSTLPHFHTSSPKPLTSSDCFAAVSANDIVDERTGQKVCGCALKLTHSAVLVQASLPIGPPLVDPRLVFVQPNLDVVPIWDADRFEKAFNRAVLKLWPVALAHEA